MLSSDRIMGTKEAAEYLGVSTSAFSNLRNRYEDFPKPYAELTATPVFDRLDIQKWAEEHQRFFHSTEVISSLGNYKTIAICGRPRVGKSYLISLFSEDVYTYRNACSKHGDDFTQCAVQNIIREEINEPHAVFHSRKQKTQHDENEKECEKDGMDGLEAPLDAESFSRFMNEVTDYLKYKRNQEESIDDTAYIEIFMRPSVMAKEIMKEYHIETLIITDTPGVSENYDLVPIEKADLVLLVAGDSNQMEAQKSYQELVKGLAPLIASSHVCFLYRVTSPCDDDDEYDELQKIAHEAMESFSRFFIDWKGRIIESSMEVLQPAKTVLGIPSMKPKKLCIAETLFVKDLKVKIMKGLAEAEVSSSLLRKAITEANVNEETVSQFIREILGRQRYLPSKISNLGLYNLTRFDSEKHDRVKTRDNYELLYAANVSCRKQLKQLYNHFIKFDSADYSEEWKQAIIKYLYKSLTLGVKIDSGIARGYHPWEDCPPITMFVIESILAGDIYEALVDELNSKKTVKDYYSRYIEVMKKHGVTSNSWNYVDIDLSDIKALNKIEFIKECGLEKVRTDDLSDFVWSRYTLGLQKVAEYNIWKEIAKIFEIEEINQYACNQLYYGISND